MASTQESQVTQNGVGVVCVHTRVSENIPLYKMTVKMTLQSDGQNFINSGEIEGEKLISKFNFKL